MRRWRQVATIRTNSVVVLVVIGVLWLFGACTTSAGEERQSVASKITAELAAKHGALTGWEENLEFTMEAQDRLVTGKPILFTGSVDDVINRDGLALVRFSFWSSFHTFLIELTCDPAEVVTILAPQENGQLFRRLNQYAVVAKIHDVSKPVI